MSDTGQENDNGRTGSHRKKNIKKNLGINITEYYGIQQYRRRRNNELYTLHTCVEKITDVVRKRRITF